MGMKEKEEEEEKEEGDEGERQEKAVARAYQQRIGKQELKTTSKGWVQSWSSAWMLFLIKQKQDDKIQ
jgi:hypothetical protein